MPAPLRIVFMGTPDFAVPCLAALLERPDVANVLAVYTQPDRPAGRGLTMRLPPIKTLALSAGLPVFQPENINKDNEPRRLADLMTDVVVVVAYAQFLGKAVLSLPRLGCVNVHSSLLPKYRGAAPIQYALLNGERETGVSTMKLVREMDAGPILLQSSMSIPDSMTSDQLHDALAKLGATLLIKTLEGLRDGTIKDVPQDESQVSYAKLISKEDGRIVWSDTSANIVNRLRAFTPWPGAFATTTRGILKIHDACRVDGPAQTQNAAAPGLIDTSEGRFLVKCGDGWLELRVVQLEGKKTMTAEHFVNGLKSSQEEFKFTTSQ